MIVSYTSIDEVIGRVVRNTRIQDSSYLLDCKEWIPEAMGYMRTKVEVQTRYKDILINFHKGMVPSGLLAVKAVEYRGTRLKYGNDVRSADSIRRYPPDRGTVSASNGFVSVPIVHSNPTNDDSSLIYDSTAIPVCSSLCEADVCGMPCSNEYYSTELGYINTSFQDGWIRVHYTRIGLDEKGMPLIPDDEDYKQALYLYVRAMMIGTGWNDPVFKYEQLMQHFEKHAARAMGKIRYPSTDQMEMKVNNSRRLIPDEGYFDRFFSSPNEERQYGEMYTAVTYNITNQPGA